jgi:hypothetical protein
MGYPMWEKDDVVYLLSMTVPPNEEKNGFDDRILFIDTLILAIVLKDEGKLLLEELRKNGHLLLNLQ